MLSRVHTAAGSLAQPVRPRVGDLGAVSTPAVSGFLLTSHLVFNVSFVMSIKSVFVHFP